MKAKGQGQIAIVSSVTGYGGLPTSAAYGATKAALINMAESLKFDLDKMGIRLQIINPGFVETAATARTNFRCRRWSARGGGGSISEGLKSAASKSRFPNASPYA
jgi:NAD(P)-dependent dehydrogenase (short-subunit alcohol dehydrogenase family)